MEEYAKYDKLLSEIELCGITSLEGEKEKNFFELAGYPHYENVVSNILRFFLDTNGAHGMKDLWLSSLLECYEKKHRELFGVDKVVFSTDVLDIQREYVCTDDKRIDILIELQKDIVIIENKIYAKAINPWGTYHSTVKKKYHSILEEKEPVEILLSMKKEGKKSSSNGAMFVNITYKDLLDRVQEKVGKYGDGLSYKWFVLMNEFIINLRGFTMSEQIDKEWQTFLAKNASSIQKLKNQYEKDIKLKHSWIKNLYEGLKNDLGNNAQYISGIHRPDSMSGYTSLIIDIPYKNDVVVVEPYFYNEYSKHEWEKMTVLYIPIWCRGSKNVYSHEELLLKLEDKGYLIDKTIPETRDWVKWVIVKEYDFEKDDIRIDAVAKEIKAIVEIIVSLSKDK